MITVKWIDVDNKVRSVKFLDDDHANTFISMMTAQGLKAWKV